MSKYIAIIRDNATGETRETKQKRYGNDIETLEYMWGEGNWSCDCNRHLEFERSVNKNYDNDDMLCGDEKYSVPYLMVDGEKIKIDNDALILNE